MPPLPQWLIDQQERRRRRLQQNGAAPPQSEGAGRIGPRDTPAGRVTDDILSAIGSAGETVARKGFGLGTENYGDVGEFVEGMHTLANPWAGEKDEGGLYDVGSQIASGFAEKPVETARAVGGVPVEAILAATDALGITDAGAIEKLKTEFKENPLLSVVDIIPMAKMITTAGKGGRAAIRGVKAAETFKEKAMAIPKAAGGVLAGAGATPRAAIAAVTSIKDKVAGLSGRLAEAGVGMTTGTQRAPKIARLAQREAVKEFVKETGVGAKETAKRWWASMANPPPPSGFGAADIADVAQITNKVKNYVFGTIPAKANARYAEEFSKIKLKDSANQLDFPDLRQKMHDALQRPRDAEGGYGVRVTVDPKTNKTVLDFSDAIEGLKDNADSRRRLTEIVEKMDDMDNRFSGKRLSQMTKEGRAEAGIPSSASANYYNLRELKNALDGLRETQFEKKMGVNTRQADRFIDEAVGGVRKEFGDKMDGFDEMQKKREIVFDETDKMITAFFGNDPKELRTKYRLDKDRKIGSDSKFEQLLSPKDTHVVNQNVVDHFEGFIKKEFDVDLDIKSAVADVRLSGDDPKGLARIPLQLRMAGGAGSYGALTFAGLTGPPAIAAVVGGMMITSPDIVGRVMRGIGATQGVADALSDAVRKGRKALTDKGVETSVLDAMTFTEMVERNMQDADLLSQVGSIGSSPQEINERYSFTREQ